MSEDQPTYEPGGGMPWGFRVIEDQTTDVCDCYACIGNAPAYDGAWLTVGMTRMILCAICGNKRCPHGTDHRNPCSGSNEPNQSGSRYQYGTP